MWYSRWQPDPSQSRMSARSPMLPHTSHAFVPSASASNASKARRIPRRTQRQLRVPEIRAAALLPWRYSAQGLHQPRLPRCE